MRLTVLGRLAVGKEVGLSENEGRFGKITAGRFSLADVVLNEEAIRLLAKEDCLTSLL